MAGPEPTESEIHQGNWYVLVMGLPRPEAPLTLAPGLTLVPLESPLSVFDLAAAGAVGFREWAILKTAKDQVRELLESLPDDASLKDIQYHLSVRQKIQKGLEAAELGRTITHEEVARRMSRWLKR